jgi:2-oxoglutarate ferredoxin oxidoreductase subunit gamma
MSKTRSSRGELIIAGLGGMGVLSAGQILLEAAFQQYKNVSYAPTYGFAKRGGLCQCTVIYSNEKIASPLVEQAHAVMLLDSSQFATFEPRVKPDGIIIAEKASFFADRSRDDYRLFVLPGLEIAVGMGSSVVNNFIMLGAYVSITGAVSVEHIEEALNTRYRNDQKVFQRNLSAFRRGLEIGKGVCQAGASK